MPGLVPGIHTLTTSDKKYVDGRDKPGHDDQMDYSCVFTNARLIQLTPAARFFS